MSVDDQLNRLKEDADRRITVPTDLQQVLKAAMRDADSSLRRSLWQRFRPGKTFEIAAASLLVAGVIGIAAVRNRNSVGAQSMPDACGFRETIAANLRLAAETLPVPSAEMSRRDTTKEDALKEAGSFGASGEAMLQELQAKGHFGYTVTGDQVNLSTWASPSQFSPSFLFTQYRFTRGGLTEQSQIPELMAQLRSAVSNGQVTVSSVSTTVRKMGQAEYYRFKALDRYAWTLKDVLRWSEAEDPRPTCVTKVVPVFRNGPVEQIDLPMLSLPNGKYVGFQGEQVITFSEGEGLYGGGNQTIWYTVPGLLPTDKRSGKQGDARKQPARKSQAEVKQAEAERLAKVQQLEKLKAEIAQAEAKFAALKVPKLEEVGEAEYTRVARESALLGTKVKELHLELVKVQWEVDNPLSDEVKLEKEIDNARAVYTEAEREGKKNTSNPDSAKLLDLNQRQLAALDQVERAFKAGTKPPKELLTEMERLRNMQ